VGSHIVPQKKPATSELLSVGTSAGTQMVDISRKTQSPNKFRDIEEVKKNPAPRRKIDINLKQLQRMSY
jgi:hypothetical protein